MSCKVATELKKEMDEADIARRKEMPDATKPLNQEIGSGWTTKSYKEKSSVYEAKKEAYEKHKNNCIECRA